MASIYDLKPAFQNLIRPLSETFIALQLTPNQVTITALLISALNGLAIYLFPQSHWPLLCIPLTLFLRMMLNAIDGMMAREHLMQSELGAFLNEIGDVLSDAFLYLPFCIVPHIVAPLVVLIVVFAITVEMTGVVAIAVGSKRRYEGPMGKSDRAFIFGAVGLLLGCGFNISSVVNLVFVVVLLMLLVTMVNRTRSALQTKNL